MKKTIITLILVAIILAVAVEIYQSSKDSVKTPRASESEQVENTDETQTEDTEAKTGTDNSSTNTVDKAPVASIVGLEGTTFRMTSFDGDEIPADSNYTIKFSEGKILAKICNNMNGAYTLQNNVLTVEQMVSTMMYCSSPENLMEIESVFGKILSEGVTLSQSGPNLGLVSNDGTVLGFSVLPN